MQQLDAVSVIGQGETRQVQRITAQDVAVLPPGTSIQKLLNRIPGVNVQSNDAFGANEESQTISLRGFNGVRLGYTLDGLPLGDNAYGNYNGLNISRALIAENFGGVELASGIGSLGTASTSNLGGTVQPTGGIASLGWDIGPHHLEAGVWYERNKHHVERNFYWIDGPIDDDIFLSNPNRRLFSQDYVITTKQAYVQGTFKLLDERLTLDIGAKSPHTTMTARETPGIAVEAPVANGELKASKAAPIALQPEKSTGYRLVRASLVGYDVDCTSPACTTRFFNVGSVSSRGGELTFIWKPTAHLQWYNSASINRSTYDDNYVQNGAVIPTAGKSTVDTPSSPANSAGPGTVGTRARCRPWTRSSTSPRPSRPRPPTPRMEDKLVATLDAHAYTRKADPVVRDRQPGIPARQVGQHASERVVQLLGDPRSGRTARRRHRMRRD
ncbi:Plug domain-containing protein [Pantoea ananatis]|uniref:Plug domain-containing protein n=1 Tax=Pantoea ananas TaxID=553 RepID=UPI00221E3B47|nr:Plug domain-containing protein [Pantoea ananatis]